jgi:pimeloyl-ACP methyl ester carboxylesterase
MNGSASLDNTIRTGSDIHFVNFGHSVGWFHTSWSDTAVLICPDLGRGANVTYGSFRLLASDLAQLGYPTLRLDYPGTGNAPDRDGQLDAKAWIESIAAAADWLRRNRVQKLILCGYRLGGLLVAITAARRQDVHAVILLDPVFSGSAYLRELRITSQLIPADMLELESSAAALEIDGLVLPDNAQAMLKHLDLLLLPAKPAHRILLLGLPTSAAAAKLPNHLRALGADVTEGSFTYPNEYDGDGYIRPSSIFNVVREWLDTTAPPGTCVEPRCRQPGYAVISTASFTEEPVTFGLGQKLAGILCRPGVAVSSDFVLLIGNAGSVPQPGYARFHVRLARMLAAAGIASLRFDFSGIGESEAGVEEFTHVYNTDRCPDFVAAIDLLDGFGYRCFGVAGLCSGAYHAWCASITDERIGTVILVNPSTFLWRKDQDFAQFVSNSTKSTKFYLDGMAQSSSWRRLLCGQLDLPKAARTLRTHMLRYLKSVGGHTLAALGWPTDETRLRRAVRQLNIRGVRVLFLLGSTDLGVDVVRAHFGHLKVPFGQIELLTGVDHAISRLAMQQKTGQAVVEFLRNGSGPKSSVQVEGAPAASTCPNHVKYEIHKEIAC